MTEQENAELFKRILNVNGPVQQLLKCSEILSTMSATCSKIAIDGTINNEKIAEEAAELEINMNILNIIIAESKGTQQFPSLKKDYYDFKIKKLKNTVEMLEKLIEEQRRKQIVTENTEKVI